MPDRNDVGAPAPVHRRSAHQGDESDASRLPVKEEFHEMRADREYREKELSYGLRTVQTVFFPEGVGRQNQRLRYHRNGFENYQKRGRILRPVVPSPPGGIPGGLLRQDRIGSVSP